MTEKPRVAIQPGGEAAGAGGVGGGRGKTEKAEEELDPRRSGVAGGDTVRDCGIIEYVLPYLNSPDRDRDPDLVLITVSSLPPVLCDPAVAKAHYDKIENEVEEGVRKSQIREKAMPTPKTEGEAEA